MTDRGSVVTSPRSGRSKTHEIHAASITGLEATGPYGIDDETPEIRFSGEFVDSLLHG